MLHIQRGHPSLGAILADPPLRHASTVGRLPNGDTALDPVHTAPAQGVILNTIHDIRISKDVQGTIAVKDGRKRGKQGKESPFLHFRESFRRHESLLLGKDSVPKPIFAPHIVPAPDFQTVQPHKGDAAVAE